MALGQPPDYTTSNSQPSLNRGIDAEFFTPTKQNDSNWLQFMLATYQRV